MAEPPPVDLDLVSVAGLLAGASNATLLAHDSNGGAWVYKPDRGQLPLWDFATGSLSRREVACSRISVALRLGVVPETVMAEGPYGIGSAQRYLDEDLTWDPRPAIVEMSELLWPVVVLDLIANNADRKVGHLLRQPDRQEIWAIDNGLTFHVDDKLRTVLWTFAGEPIPRHWTDLLDAELIVAGLEGLLSPAEVEAAAHRVERLAADPVHPDPPVDRPALPWPVW